MTDTGILSCSPLLDPGISITNNFSSLPAGSLYWIWLESKPGATVLAENWTAGTLNQRHFPQHHGRSKIYECTNWAY